MRVTRGLGVGLIRVGASPEFTTVTSTMSRLNFCTYLTHCGGIGYLWQIQRVLQLYGFEKQRILARCDFWAWRKVKLAKYLANAIFWLFIIVMTVTCLLQILDKK